MSSRKQKVVKEEELPVLDENPEATEEETPTEQGEPEAEVEETKKGKSRLKKAAPFLIGFGSALVALVAGSRIFGGGRRDAYVAALDDEYGDHPENEEEPDGDSDNHDEEESIDEETAD